MYAIILSGGKQYRIEEGDTIAIELLPSSKEGDQVSFKEILLVSDGTTTYVGKPTLTSFAVLGQYVGETKGPKEVCMKYKRRKNQRRKIGHRQTYCQIRITNIQAA